MRQRKLDTHELSKKCQSWGGTASHNSGVSVTQLWSRSRQCFNLNCLSEILKHRLQQTTTTTTTTTTTERSAKTFLTLTARTVSVCLCLTFSTTPYAPRPRTHRLSRSSASIENVLSSMVIDVLESKSLGIVGVLEEKQKSPFDNFTPRSYRTYSVSQLAWLGFYFINYFFGCDRYYQALSSWQRGDWIIKSERKKIARKRPRKGFWSKHSFWKQLQTAEKCKKVFQEYLWTFLYFPFETASKKKHCLSLAGGSQFRKKSWVRDQVPSWGMSKWQQLPAIPISSKEIFPELSVNPSPSGPWWCLLALRAWTTQIQQ